MKEGEHFTDLFVQKHVDDGVVDGAALGKDGWHDAGRRGDEPRLAKGGKECHSCVGQPAEEEAQHHHHHHHQDALLPAPARPRVGAAHLGGTEAQVRHQHCLSWGQVMVHRSSGTAVMPEILAFIFYRSVLL